jgi:integrase
VTKKTRRYVCEKMIRGERRLFFRITTNKGGKRSERYIELPRDEDSPQFDREYWALRSGKSEKLAPPMAKTTYGNLIQQYRASPGYRKLKDGTKRPYERVMNQLLERNADKDVRKVTRAQVRAIHQKYADTPRKADHYVQVLSVLFTFASNELEWIATNPASGIKLYGAQKEWQPWPEQLQKTWERYCIANDEDIALTAMYLGTGTGQRPGDLVTMEESHFDGEYMAVLQEKTNERLWVYCPKRLRDFLAQRPKKGRFILAKNLTEPMTYNTVEKAFRRVRAAIGASAEGHVMHGWRYTAAVELAEAGCSDAQIQSVTGHKTTKMVLKYRSRANQKQLSKQAQEKRQ